MIASMMLKSLNLFMDKLKTLRTLIKRAAAPMGTAALFVNPLIFAFALLSSKYSLRLSILKSLIEGAPNETGINNIVQHLIN